MDITLNKYRDLKKRYRKLRNAYNKYRHMVQYKDNEQPPKPEYKEIKSELNPFFEPPKNNDQGNPLDNHMFKYSLEYMDIDDIKKLFKTTRSLVKQNIFILKTNIDYSEKNVREEIKNGDVRTFIIDFQDSMNENFVINFINNKEIIDECFNNVSRIIIDGSLISNAIELNFSNFRNLISLEFKRFEGKLNILDLSNLSKLRYLDIPSDTPILIKELRMSECSKIQHLNITNYKISSKKITSKLVLTGCTNLKVLDIHNNKIQELNVTNCTALETLNASYNRIQTIIGLSSCTHLSYLDISRNNINSIFLYDNSKIKYLDISKNEIPEVILTGCTALEQFIGSYNRFISIEGLSGCYKKLKKLDISKNLIDSALDFSGFSNLKHLNIYGNKIPKVKLKKLEALEYFGANDNRLSSIEGLRDCIKLKHLEIRNNKNEFFQKITMSDDGSYKEENTLNLSFHPELISLDISGNLINKVILTGCTVLETFYALNNRLSSIEGLRDCIKLKKLDISKNLIDSALDFSGFSYLDKLEIYTNKIPKVILTGCTALQYFDARYNRLSSIEGLRDCIKLVYMVISDNKIDSALDFSGFSDIKYLYIDRNSIPKVILTGCTALEIFDANNNKITSITDLSSCTRLKDLDISNNQIDSALDFSGFSYLNKLHIYRNSIPKVILTGCTALEIFDASNNKITSITDLSKCTKLKRLYISYNNLEFIFHKSNFPDLYRYEI